MSVPVAHSTLMTASSTTGAPPDALISDGAGDRVELSKWARSIATLREWRAGKATFEDLDADALERAIEWAVVLGESGMDAPMNIGVTTDGGIAFEWRSGDLVIQYDILDASHAEYTEFHGPKLVRDICLQWDESAGWIRSPS